MKSFVIIAQQHNKIDYVKLAYGLALSIKITQNIKNVVLLIDSDTIVLDQYKKVFDTIIVMSQNYASNTEWKVQNKWQINDELLKIGITEAILLDADVIMTVDITEWWNVLSSYDFWICTKPRTFRNELVVSEQYRRIFLDYKLPNVYSTFVYLKPGSKISIDVCTMSKTILVNWPAINKCFFNGAGPTYPSGDLLFAITLKFLDLVNDCTSSDNVPTFVHMKTHVQNFKDTHSLSENWTTYLNVLLNDDIVLYVGVFKQCYPFHYYDKLFLTEDKLSLLENLYYNIGV